MNKDRFYGYNTYFRTKEELKIQLDGLTEIKNIFEDMNIDYFLSAGTMLGSVRTSSFIPWDWNVSIACLSEQFDEKYDIFLQKMQEKSFICISRIKNGYFALNAYKNNVKYVIESMKLEGEYRTLPLHKVPAKFFTDKQISKIDGIDFYVCINPEEYLEWHYGKDWKTPKVVKHRNECINKKHRK